MMGDLPIVFLTVVMATIVAAVFGMTSHKDERKDCNSLQKKALSSSIYAPDVGHMKGGIE
jgi:hypothetical protein